MDPTPSPVVLFEHDAPALTFVITEGEELFETTNYLPELHVIDSAGNLVLTYPLTASFGGVVSLGYDASLDYEPLFALEVDTCYTAQIFLRAIPATGQGLGQLDIIDPLWLNYIPPPDHILHPGSGVQKLDRTAVTEIPWDMRESYRLRGAQNG